MIAASLCPEGRSAGCPNKLSLDGSRFFNRDVCGDPQLNARIAQGSRVHADTIYIDAKETRRLSGGELNCPSVSNTDGR